MDKNGDQNVTLGTDFLLMGLTEIFWLQIVLFVVFLAISLVTVMGNLLLIILRRIDPRLHTPMYFFLSHLSFIDISVTLTIVPKLLAIFLLEDKSISFLGCALQMYFSVTLGSAECFILVAMSYDRHTAICQPLRYQVLMSKRVCVFLAATCWISSLVNCLAHTVFTFRRPFCKSREIRHFFCEIQPLLRLSCDDTRIHEMWVFASTATIVLCSFLLTLFSYVHIISTILKIQSSKARSKVFSTCSSHLLVVVIFYTTIMSTYMQPISRYTSQRDRVIAVLYTTVIPMTNPLIYSLRNKDVKGALRKAIGTTCCRPTI
ncbi:olfactory receptor 10J1 [Lissotriton helveticus]